MSNETEKINALVEQVCDKNGKVQGMEQDLFVELAKTFNYTTEGQIARAVKEWRTMSNINTIATRLGLGRAKAYIEEQEKEE